MNQQSRKDNKSTQLFCPQNLCFHWLIEGESNSTGLHNNLEDGCGMLTQVGKSMCGCSFGSCIRISNKAGEKDWYEPCEVSIKRELKQILIRGVTGFRYLYEAPLPNTDLEKFKQDCYEIERKLGIKITEFYFELYTNYVVCIFEIDSKEICCLLNGVYPFIAFSPTKININFIDNELLYSEFSKSYKVFTTELLSIPINKKMLTNLSETELDQVEYWEPKTLGDIVFNNWD